MYLSYAWCIRALRIRVKVVWKVVVKVKAQKRRACCRVLWGGGCAPDTSPVPGARGRPGGQSIEHARRGMALAGSGSVRFTYRVRRSRGSHSADLLLMHCHCRWMVRTAGKLVLVVVDIHEGILNPRHDFTPRMRWVCLPISGVKLVDLVVKFHDDACDNSEQEKNDRRYCRNCVPDIRVE